MSPIYIAAIHTLTIVKLPCITLPSEWLIVAGTLLCSVVTATRTCLHSIQGTVHSGVALGVGYAPASHTTHRSAHCCSQQVSETQCFRLSQKLSPVVKRKLCWHTENMYINYTMIVRARMHTYIRMHARLL